jgi:very-short-patch-repair endonuclease
MGGYLNRLYDPIFEGLLVHSNPRLIKTISESLMDKKDYIIRQLGRTKHKKYESYVVSRIFHLLDDLDIKFITQQYVSRPEGRALTDLYFPQIQLHVEVDEEHHKSNVEDDRIREADIVNATGHEVVGIDVSTSIEQINDDISNLVGIIRTKVDRLKGKNLWVPWDLDSEFDSITYIRRGYIDISDNVAFKRIKDACNCFGHDYKGYQKAGASHPDSEILLWFPKLFPNDDWINEITDDENTIYERNTDDEISDEHVSSVLTQKKGEKHKRIVFAKVKGTLGDVLYRFRGLYKLDVDESNPEVGLVWNRSETRVVTYLNLSSGAL